MLLYPDKTPKQRGVKEITLSPKHRIEDTRQHYASRLFDRQADSDSFSKIYRILLDDLNRFRYTLGWMNFMKKQN